MSRRRLEIGEDNIAESKPRKYTKEKTKTVNGHKVTYKKTFCEMQWYINLDGTVSKHCTRTVGNDTRACTQQARAHARKLRDLHLLPGSGNWNMYNDMGEFVDKVCIASVKANEYASPLRPRTQARYLRCLTLFHERTQGMLIKDAIVPATLSSLFKDIAVNHGNPSAKQAAKIVSRYVMEVARNRQVIASNPLRPLTLEVTVPDEMVKPHRGEDKPEGGQALSAEERRRVVNHLLKMDPNAPARKRWSAKQMTAKRLNLIDMTLTQATCGLRVGECRLLKRENVYTRDGMFILEVLPEASKTKRGREVPVFDERVVKRLRRRLRRLPKEPDTPLFPTPVTGKVWERGNCQKAVRAFYDELADELDIPLLREVGTHVWRTTLNSEWADKHVPVERRAAYFGHSPEMNRSRYTDFTDLTALREQVEQG